MAIKIKDENSGENVYLFSSAEEALKGVAAHKRSFYEVVAHSSELGFYLKEKTTGKKFDSQGKISNSVL